VVNIWNSLPDSVVDADTLNTLKNRLDKHWLDQEHDNCSLGLQFLFRVNWNRRCFNLYVNVMLYKIRANCARLFTLDWIGLDVNFVVQQLIAHKL